MSVRFSNVIVFFVLAIAVALVPIACSSSGNDTDAAHDGISDKVSNMTPG